MSVRRGAGKLAESGRPLAARIYKAAEMQPTPVTVRSMLDFGRAQSPAAQLEAAKWLYNELPIRLARQVVAMDRIPYGFCLMPSVRKVRSWYCQSFREILEGGYPSTAADEAAFRATLDAILKRHAPTLFTMARGMYEMRRELSALFHDEEVPSTVRVPFDGSEPVPGAEGDGMHGVDIGNLNDIHAFLDKFYSTRISLRTLIGHHLAVHDDKGADERRVGLFDRECHPNRIVSDAAAEARSICLREKGDAPEVIVEGGERTVFCFLPDHLHYITLELVKNSVRAVVERCAREGRLDDMPPVRVRVTDGNDTEDVCIRVSDDGGGLPRSSMPQVWSYLYTTAPFQESLVHEDFSDSAPLAGLGYGLPISRQYARYFGGDLHLVSLEGESTDAYLYLTRLGKREQVH